MMRQELRLQSVDGLHLFLVEAWWRAALTHAYGKTEADLRLRSIPALILIAIWGQHRTSRVLLEA